MWFGQKGEKSQQVRGGMQFLWEKGNKNTLGTTVKNIKGKERVICMHCLLQSKCKKFIKESKLQEEYNKPEINLEWSPETETNTISPTKQNDDLENRKRKKSKTSESN